MNSVGLSSSSSDLLATFTDDTDISQWINDLLDGQGDVSELATRLEVACQDTAGQLEQSIDDISRIVPRIAYDLHFLRESALFLQGSLSKLKTRVSSSIADNDTTLALQRLGYLETIKTRMEASRDVLREAESWSTLESEVTSLLREPNYEKAAERLADANKSMVVFQNTAEYETRRTLLVSLQNQLEASLSSALVTAINAHDVASCKTYYAIFAHIQRESEFHNYYNGSRRAPVLQIWTTTPLSDVDGESPQADTTPMKLSDLLSRFFADFLSLVNGERSYAPSIFPNPQYSISVFVQSAIDALTPSLSQRLSGMAEHYGASALPEMIRAFRAAEEFAVMTDKVMEKVGYATLLSPQTPAPQTDDISKSHSRRLSKRMSMSRRLVPTRAPSSISGDAWELALFEPFIDFQAEYQTLEKRYLDHSLAAVLNATRRAKNHMDSDGARIFRERSVDVFSMAEEAFGRCMSFTHGYGAAGLLKALDHIFSSFLEISLAELLTAEYSEDPSFASLLPKETFEELDYSVADWRIIQLILHLLDACRWIRERLGVLDARIRTGLVQVASAFRHARSDPQGLYISNTTRGEAQLLSQSTLNSVELQSLLDTLESGQMNTSELGTSQSEQQVMLLEGARKATVEFTTACQARLQDTLLRPLVEHLSTYAASPVWTATTDSGRSAYEPSIPSFSLSPSSTIQRVAEGLLNLPRLIEVYAEDDALAFSIETLPFVDASVLQLALTPPSPPPQPHSPTDLKHMRHLSSSHSLTSSSLPPPSQRTLPPDIVISAWLSSLTLSLLSHLTTKVLPAIRPPSASGGAQLASDLGYLSNIVRALNVESAELERWKETVVSGEEDGKQKAATTS